MSGFKHVSVLLDECIEWLDIDPRGTYIDCTLGGGGHSSEILKRLSDGRLIGIDRDGDAIAAASARLGALGKNFTAVRSNFADISGAAQSVGVEKADGILFDLGVSSYQLDTAERGFSYMADAPLDMRMDSRDGMSAADVVNTYSEGELRRILSEYGEEKFSGRVAAAIVRARSLSEIKTTLELSEIITSAIPQGAAKKEKQHPAKRSFQAIRMEVNGELAAIRLGLRAAAELLAPGGRLCVITFHSGEDRLVKSMINELSSGCTCPRDFPVCVCGKKPVLKNLTRHPIISGEEELENNPRARSAKLRVAEKL
ncbi:MAG: 16S rRNA (cytosine(1402)-N(4))-methyltransferase RsmH [Ruminococcaceae bacterium]|nr:16S rRNA (cytosine(1402)-N(4))-methyltransferase RsmH [Oscillospiraceae bacterium]